MKPTIHSRSSGQRVSKSGPKSSSKSKPSKKLHKRHKLPSSLYSAESDDDEEIEDEGLQSRKGLSKVSFDVLAKVQDEYEEKYGASKSKGSDDESDDGAPEEEGYSNAQGGSDDDDDDDDLPPEESTLGVSSGPSLAAKRQAREEERKKLKRAHKHAPSEVSIKKRVSVVRDIPGLEPLYKAQAEDIRFDTVFGKADLQQARKNYAFLDDYRKDEISKLKGVLREAKMAEKANEAKRKKKKQGSDDEEGEDEDEEDDGYELPTMGERQKENVKRQIQSLEGQLVTMKRRDFENEVVSKYNKQVKDGARDGPKFLKRSDKRKLVLAEQFKSMRKKDVTKSLERKRKKNLAKERQYMPMERRG